MSQQTVSSFLNPTVRAKECRLSVLKQADKISGPKDNALDFSAARQMTHTSRGRHFPAGQGFFIVSQLNKNNKKSSSLGISALQGVEDNQTSATCKPQRVFKKKPKVADIEVHEKGTEATPLIISCGPALQCFSGLLVCSNYALSFQNLEQVFKSEQLVQVFFLIIYSTHLMQVSFVTPTLEFQLRVLMLQYIP